MLVRVLLRGVFAARSTYLGLALHALPGQSQDLHFARCEVVGISHVVEAGIDDFEELQ